MSSTDCGNESIRTCSPDRTLCRRSHLLPLLLLFVPLFIIYFNSFGGTWIFDDFNNIVDNRNVHLTSLDRESITSTFYGFRGDKIGRPLSYLSFGINHFFHGLDEFGYHLVNFIIHCMAALFLYLFIFYTLHLPVMKGRFDGRAGSIALLAAVLWATAPIQVTSVTYMVQRMASMAGMFFIMAMFFYLMGRTVPGLYRKFAWFSLCALSGLLAFASKENAVLLLPTLFLYDVLLIQGPNRKNLKRNLLIGGISLVIMVFLAFVMANPIAYFTGEGYANREFNLWERLMTQPRVLLFYLSLMIYPMTDRFTLIYEIPISRSLLSPWTTIPAMIFWTGWAALGLWLAKRQPLISFCLLFFIVNHLVESTIIPLELVYEHRNYIPSMMLFLLAAWAIIAFLRDFSRKRLLQVMTCLFIVITIAGQGYTVIQRNVLFEHPLYLWADNAEKSPGLSRVHTSLGKAYEDLGFREEARAHYERAIEVNRYHRYDLRAVPLNNLGNYYLDHGRPEVAMEYFTSALEKHPNQWQALMGTAGTFVNMGNYEAGRELLEAYPAIAQYDVRYHILLGLTYLFMEDYEKAIVAVQNVTAGDRGASYAHKVLGESHLNLGNLENSKLNWEIYVQEHPDDLESYMALFWIGQELGDEGTMRMAARSIFAMKGDRSWRELQKGYEQPEGVVLVPPVFSGNAGEILAAVRNMLKDEL